MLARGACQYGLFADELIFRLPRHSHAQNLARYGDCDRLDYGRIQDAARRSFFQPYARYNDISVACDLADREVKPICELVNLKFKTSLPSTYRFVISLACKVRYMKRNILVKFKAEF